MYVIHLGACKLVFIFKKHEAQLLNNLRNISASNAWIKKTISLSYKTFLSNKLMMIDLYMAFSNPSAKIYFRNYLNYF